MPVVYQNIDCAVSFYCLIYELVAERHIRSVAQNVYSLVAFSLDLVYDLLGALFVSAYYYDFRTLAGKKDCCCAAHTGGGTCYDSYLVF